MRRHAVRHGHHDLDREEARLVDTQADLEAVLERLGQECDVGRMIAGVSWKTSSLSETYLNTTGWSHSNASITSRS